MNAKGTPSPEDVTRSSAPTPIGQGEAGKLPETTRPFQSYMQAPTEPNPMLAGGKPMQVSPFDLAQGQVLAAGPTFNTIQAQAKSAQLALGDVSTQLNTPNLKLRQSSKYLLKNKLGSASTLIRSASSKLGVEEKAPRETPAGAGPIQRFLSLITDGQDQLEAAQSQLKALQSRGESLSPADMLLVQIKLNKAQQEIEYSSLLLSKAVDDMKMMMNIQL
jgi:hypothetical protein